MRVQFIARYRDPTMDRKLRYMAAMEGVTVRQVRPAYWRDDLLSANQGTSNGELEQVSLPMIGNPGDPHRAVYRTLSFGLRQFRPDILHAEEEPDSLAGLQVVLARRLFAPRAKLILNSCQNVDRPRRPEVRWVTQQTLRAADAVLCVNSGAQAILRKQGYRGYTQVIQNVGVDADVFQPCPAPPAGSRFLIGYVGRLAAEKGIKTLLEALTQLGPEFELRLVGGGPQRSALEAQATAMGLQSPAQVAREFCQLDALVLPSLSTRVWKEQFGRVLAEAMACRVPVVGSSSGS